MQQAHDSDWDHVKRNGPISILWGNLFSGSVQWDCCIDSFGVSETNPPPHPEKKENPPVAGCMVFSRLNSCPPGTPDVTYCENRVFTDVIKV